MDRAPKNYQLIRPSSPRAETETPRINEADLHVHTSDKQQSVSRNRLINILNFLHFQNSTVSIQFRHIKYGHIVSRQVFPQPCQGENLMCVWKEPQDFSLALDQFELHNLILTDGRKHIVAVPSTVTVDEDGICLRLPDACVEFALRKRKRFPSLNIQAEIVQSGVAFRGELMEFSVAAFVVRIQPKSIKSQQWINTNAPVNLLLFSQNDILYSGDCRVLKRKRIGEAYDYIIRPLKQQIQRFQPKEYRSSRQTIVPSPTIVFKHPLTTKTTTLRVIDLSGSGFSVEEDEGNAVLIPGMVIDDIKISFSNHFSLKCRAQVIYRNLVLEKPDNIYNKCGLALLDMDTQQHINLISCLHQARDKRSYVANKMDMETLWRFFFETGFIYPEKYAYLQEHKDQIKATYEKLYTQSPRIARHFIFQERGSILGHMAMVRFYKNSWLIHHHASRRSTHNWGGFAVLNQIGRFINDSHRLHSMKMDYVFCYFRPENKFPNHVFGGIARSTKDPKGCSLDTFAYFHIPKHLSPLTALPYVWSLTDTTAEDLIELQSFYEYLSGGLMLESLDLVSADLTLNGLPIEFNKLGLKRQRRLFSLKMKRQLVAVIMVNISDLGLNMSDLTNSINTFVVDPDQLSKDILLSVLSMLSLKYGQGNMPNLLYPPSYAEALDLGYERKYTLWALNMHHTDYYFRYLKRLLKFIQH